ncbi:MAG: hypothetical protein ACYCYK_07590 [Candidatus Dormibacteria bacterium]
MVDRVGSQGHFGQGNRDLAELAGLHLPSKRGERLAEVDRDRVRATIGQPATIGQRAMGVAANQVAALITVKSASAARTTWRQPSPVGITIGISEDTSLVWSGS